MILQSFEATCSPYPRLLIRRDALEQNLRLIRTLIQPGVKVMVPIKANAYGCGMEQILPVLQDSAVEMLGVANPFEGVALRAMGWSEPVLNLGGFYREHIALFWDHAITPSVTDLWQIEALQAQVIERGRPVGVHLKLDLGMGRIGLKPENISEAAGLLKECDGVVVEGIFTHFPNADQPELPDNGAMLQLFSELSGQILEELALSRSDVLLHAANSAALMLQPDSHFDMVRPGLSFYGYFQTFEELESLGQEFSFSPSLVLKALPVSLRLMNSGEPVSYGSTYRVTKEHYPVGVFPLGYADGIPRALSNQISFEGHPLHGRVTMDQIVLGGVETNAPVNLLGPGSPPLEYWAKLCDTSTYEIMTGLGRRFERVLI